MPRKVTLVVVCEDILHATFVRAFLYRRGFTRHQLTFRTAPHGAGDAKQHVCQELCRELTALRRFARSGRGLLVIVDADNLAVAERRRWVQEACRASGVDPPGESEAVFTIVPKWEIENWLAYSRHERVDEQCNSYDKYRGRESAIYPLVEALADLCDQQQLPDAPPSLIEACADYARFRDWRRDG